MRSKTLLGLVSTVLVAVACNDVPTTLPAPAARSAPSMSLILGAEGLAPIPVTHGDAGILTSIVVDPGDPNTITYTFDDLPENCFFDAILPSTYEDLVFLTTPYLAACFSPNGTIAVVPANLAAFSAGLVYEVRIQLPNAASVVSIESYDLGGAHPRTLIAYDAAGVVLGTAVDNTVNAWATLSVSVAGIHQVGLLMGQAQNFLDNLKVTYNFDPTDKDQCKDGGWAAFGFKNQGQCVRFVETGKDSRTE